MSSHRIFGLYRGYFVTSYSWQAVLGSLTLMRRFFCSGFKHQSFVLYVPARYLPGSLALSYYPYYNETKKSSKFVNIIGLLIKHLYSAQLMQQALNQHPQPAGLLHHLLSTSFASCMPEWVSISPSKIRLIECHQRVSRKHPNEGSFSIQLIYTKYFIFLYHHCERVCRLSIKL